VSLGVAFGGGAARGNAHVGVLHGLEAAGIDIDATAGTSAGALVAALHAFGVATVDVEAAVRGLTWRNVSRVSLRKTGLFSNRELGDLCVDLLGDVNLEDSDIPLAVVAADIATGERVVLRQGPVARAVRASAAIPGVFEPVEIDGRMLVDGALVENVPVTAVRDLGARVAVAVSLDTALDFEEPSGLVSVLINAFEIAVRTGSALQVRDQADITIRPDLRGFQRWDVSQAEAVRDRGRTATDAVIVDIRRALDTLS
jgi:NTE family protein